MTDGRALSGSQAEGGISYISAVCALLLVSLAASLVPADTETSLYIVSYVSTIILQLCFLLAAVLPYRATRTLPLYGFSRPSFKACAAAPAVTVISLVSFYGAAAVFGMLLSAVGYEPSGSVSVDQPYAVALTVLSTVIVAPVCEERLMRGSCLSSLYAALGARRSGRRTLLAVALCGLVFALIHTRPEQTVYQFLFGAVLAYFTIRTGSVIPAVIAHALNNAIGIVLELPATGEAIDGFFVRVFSVWYGAVIAIAVSATLCVGGAFALRALIRSLGNGQPEKLRTTGESIPVSGGNGDVVTVAVLGALGLAVTAVLWTGNLIVGISG